VRTLLVLLAGITALQTARSGDFRNLGFDEANTNHLSYGPVDFFAYGATSDLLPGWQLYQGSTQLFQMPLMLREPLGTTVLALSGRTLDGLPSPLPPDWPYLLFFESCDPASGLFRIEQMGQIPAAARELTLRESISSFRFSPSIDDNELVWLSSIALADGRFLTTYDVSAYAGQTVKLTLTTPGNPMGLACTQAYVDSLAFVVPEPSAMALLLLGGGLLLSCTAWGAQAESRASGRVLRRHESRRSLRTHRSR